MKTMKLVIKVLFIACFTVLLTSTITGQQKGKPWDIPAKYKDMKSEVKTSDASVKSGEAVYKKNCASCHGKTGLGDGPKAKTLETFSGNFSSAEYQKETDGTIFYQIKFGRDEMPKYDKKLEDTEMWDIVNFIRTLKK